MIAAFEEVRERACRAAAALREAGTPHRIVGGHAVASWVARVDKEAVRNTKAPEHFMHAQLRQGLRRVDYFQHSPDPVLSPQNHFGEICESLDFG